MRESVVSGAIAPRPGVRELLGELTAAGVRLAVATTGTRDWVEPLLAGLFGADLFAVVVTGSDVPVLKPDPAAYIEALRRLGVPAARALAVEDSANGLRAALAAGLGCVVITNDYSRDQDFSGAAAIYPDFGACLADSGGPLLS
jgi:HAD superfamily hydrolase (TIGR01509 family)